MDGRRFDSITRTLARAKTRRSFLGGLAALAAGLVGARAADAQQPPAVVTQSYCGNVRCKNNPSKCREGCVCCVYSNGNSRCSPPGQCGAGGVVTGPTTTPSPTTTTTTTCAPVCIDRPGGCRPEFCGSGRSCGPDGCGGICGECDSPEVCCSGVCLVLGLVDNCASCGDACSGATPFCVSGTCAACVPEDGVCFTAPCCDGLECVGICVRL